MQAVIPVENTLGGEMQPSMPMMEWRKEIARRQTSNCSAAQIESLRKRAEVSRRRNKSVKAAARLQKCHAVSQRSWNVAMKSMVEIEATSAPDVSDELMSAELSTAQTRMEECQRVLRKADESDEDEECEAAMRNISHQMCLDVDSADTLAVEVEADINEMEVLLQQLRVEPSAQSEVTAKFGLFEKYLETVEATRETLHKFWGECMEEFAETGRGAVQRTIAKIDSADNLAIDFVDGRWFVYDMTCKAGKNNTIIGRVLQEIKTKLELLTREDDCPICLETLGGDVPVKVLDCCHKVCHDCWDHWTRMNDGHAWCPLCRHDEFLGTFVTDPNL